MTHIRRSYSEQQQQQQQQNYPDVIPDAESIKCTVIGDGAIGKTSLIVSYTTNDYPQHYQPTVHDFYTVRLTVAEKPVTFQLIDTAGQEQFNVIRRLSYHQSNIFLVCFNLIDPISFQNVKERWLPELKEHAPKVPFILVGLKSDGRGLSKTKSVKTDEGEQMARKIGAKCYVECSACTQKNVKNVFDTAIMTVLDQRERKQRSRLSSSSFRASLRRLSRRKNLSRSLSDSSSHSSSTSSMQRKSRSFNTSIRDIFCFG